MTCNFRVDDGRTPLPSHKLQKKIDEETDPKSNECILPRRGEAQRHQRHHARCFVASL
jgi:hypothetical protein